VAEREFGNKLKYEQFDQKLMHDEEQGAISMWTCGNAVPIVEKQPERIGTAFHS